MEVIISTLNSKFIHSSLSIRYLKSYCQDIPNIKIREYTINQNADFITGELYKENPSIIAFSCYIWNIENTLEICKRLKVVKPGIKIILGGPEVSYDGEKILEKHPYIDFIIYGEGEGTFRELIINLINKEKNFKNIEGLIYNYEGKVFKNPPRPLIETLDKIPSPYDKLDKGLKNKIVYFESSRGCPFNCQFCLSSTIKGVRFFSIERVKMDLEKLINAEVRQVKFVDRTFNANKEYAMEIMNFIMEKDPENINFHFEVTAHLLDEEMLDFLSHVKEGLFQFEIGVQSTNEKTLDTSGRTTDLNKLYKVVKEIKSYRNIHQHLDLIAGLPYEDYRSFRKSFNDVYNLGPEKLQLGFLKLLKGSGLRHNKDEYGYKFLDKPPYEVLETKYMDYGEMLRLKTIEDLVEKYGNEKFFENTIKYIIMNYYDSPFDFFEEFSFYWESKGYHKVSHSRKKLYKILYDFYLEKVGKNLSIFNEIIKYDYIFNNQNLNLPIYINRINKEKIQSLRHDILKDPCIKSNYLKDMEKEPTKKVINKTHIEMFEINILDFIENDFVLSKLKRENTLILFVYKDGVLNKCGVFNITDKITR
ncbi:MAG TPA: B12-binding domain-containing radical SAM protein [Tissierellales bacterium]|nr:B12-binding domain-containing radical SAM protein [Tissierellales bacterium]